MAQVLSIRAINRWKKKNNKKTTTKKFTAQPPKNGASK